MARTPLRVPADHNPHKPRGIVPWDAPRVFSGQTVAIVGGGPSLKAMIREGTLARLHEQFPHVRWIAVNNAYKIAPWADLLHFADCQWWRWNGKHVLANWPADRIITTATSDVTHVNAPRIKRFWRDRNDFTEDRTKLHGQDSGTQAVHLAYHLGAAKIVLFGFDMQPAADGSTHWHKEHQRETPKTIYARRFKPAIERVVRELAKRRVTVIRATEPGLAAIQFVTPSEALT